MSRKRIRNRRKHRLWQVKRYASIAILGGLVTTSLMAATTRPTRAEDIQRELYAVPFYTTAEYERIKEREQAEAALKCEKELAAIEQFQKEYEEEQERLFKEEQERIKLLEKKATEGNNGIYETDWEPGEGELDGFVPYEIPSEYKTNENAGLPIIVQKYIYVECRKRNVNYWKVIGLIEKESGYDCTKVGKAGDSGYTQIVPSMNMEKMDELEVTDIMDPYQNTSTCIALLSDLLEKYNGNYEKALTAYNAGMKGAYDDYFSKGITASEYALDIIQKAERIKEEANATEG